MNIYAQINNNRLTPVNDSDYQKLKKLKKDIVYKFEITAPRNYEFLKKYFALINLTYENQETFNNIDDMRDWLTMSAGFYRRVDTPTGEIFKPKSIAFASMSEFEFNEVYDRVLDKVCGWLKIDSETVQEQLINFM